MTTERFDVSGQTVLVTGASRGIGRRIANRFAEAGADVAICSRKAEDVDLVADDIDGRGRGDVLAVECDVRDRDDVAVFVDEAVDEFGRVTTLVNNAGTNFVSPFEDVDPEGWDAVVGVKLTGAYNCAQLAGEHMLDHGGGTIVNVASVSGIYGWPWMAPYAAANAALANLTTTLGYEWATHDIRVNAIAPGLVATPPVVRHRDIDPEDIDRRSVDRRIASIDEIVDIVQFLTSPASSYLVGETIVAAGRPDLRRTAWLEDPDV